MWFSFSYWQTTFDLKAGTSGDNRLNASLDKLSLPKDYVFWNLINLKVIC